MSNTLTRKPGGGRKPSKPEYSAAKNLTQQMKAAVDLYMEKMSLQAIADALSLNPIKVRKLLITAGVYESDTAKLVQQTFNAFRETQSYSAAVTCPSSAYTNLADCVVPGLRHLIPGHPKAVDADDVPCSFVHHVQHSAVGFRQSCGISISDAAMRSASFKNKILSILFPPDYLFPRVFMLPAVL